MNATLAQLADRHLRSDPRGVLKESFAAGEGTVLIGIDERTANTKSGQDTVWMLTNLLCRQFRLIKSIAVDIPKDVRLLPGVAAFGKAELLRDAVFECVQLVAGAHVAVKEWPDDEKGEPTMEFVIGRNYAARRGVNRLNVFADGWKIHVGSGDEIPDSAPEMDLNLGPYLAAAFAAGEVFKRLRGLKHGKGEFLDNHHQLFLSLWSGTNESCWADLEQGPRANDIQFPAFYLPGSGAVAQAIAIVMTGFDGLCGHITTTDDDVFDFTNGNRYILATLADESQDKAQFLAAFLIGRGLSAQGKKCTWQEYVVQRGKDQMVPELKNAEEKFRYHVVLSAVDDNGARHAIQNLWPKLIIGGSTEGLTAKATTYDMAGEQLCLKCFNPVADRDLIVRRRLEEARALTPEEQTKFLEKLGVDVAKALAYLANPQCDQLPTEDFAKFARPDPQMSVGFVSMAAGVLVIAQLIRMCVSGPQANTEKGAILAANFYRPGLRRLMSGPEAGCDCTTRRQTDWARLWR